MDTQEQPRTSAVPPRAADLLKTELATIERELPRLLGEGEEGRWALIHGDVVDSIWDTLSDAIQAGDRSFGLIPFLVQQVLANPRPVRVNWPVR